MRMKNNLRKFQNFSNPKFHQNCFNGIRIQISIDIILILINNQGRRNLNCNTITMPRIPRVTKTSVKLAELKAAVTKEKKKNEQEKRNVRVFICYLNSMCCNILLYVYMRTRNPIALQNQKIQEKKLKAKCRRLIGYKAVLGFYYTCHSVAAGELVLPESHKAMCLASLPYAASLEAFLRPDSFGEALSDDEEEGQGAGPSEQPAE